MTFSSLSHMFLRQYKIMRKFGTDIVQQPSLMSFLFKYTAIAATVFSILSSVDAVSNIVIDGTITKQIVDGFGFSGAFSTACDLQGMPNADRQTILDLLLGQSGA